MVKTAYKISSAFILMGIYLAVITHLRGMPEDSEVIHLLNGPLVIEHHQAVKHGQENVSGFMSLVREAKIFHGFLEPPLPATDPQEPEEQDNKEQEEQIEPPNKLSLLATALVDGCPTQSMALIQVLDNGCYWVKSGANLGPSTIVDIKDGIATIKGHQRRYVLHIKTAPRQNLIDNHKQLLLPQTRISL